MGSTFSRKEGGHKHIIQAGVLGNIPRTPTPLKANLIPHMEYEQLFSGNSELLVEIWSENMRCALCGLTSTF